MNTLLATSRTPSYPVGSTGGDVMRRFKSTNGNRFWGEAHSVRMRTPEEIAERKRRSALLRDAKRKLKKMDQGKRDA